MSPVLWASTSPVSASVTTRSRRALRADSPSAPKTKAMAIRLVVKAEGLAHAGLHPWCRPSNRRRCWLDSALLPCPRTAVTPGQRKNGKAHRRGRQGHERCACAVQAIVFPVRFRHKNPLWITLRRRKASRTASGPAPVPAQDRLHGAPHRALAALLGQAAGGPGGHLRRGVRRAGHKAAQRHGGQIVQVVAAAGHLPGGQPVLRHELRAESRPCRGRSGTGTPPSAPRPGGAPPRRRVRCRS